MNTAKVDFGIPGCILNLHTSRKWERRGASRSLDILDRAFQISKKPYTLKRFLNKSLGSLLG